jgi:hypothetical protein
MSRSPFIAIMKPQTIIASLAALALLTSPQKSAAEESSKIIFQDVITQKKLTDKQPVLGSESSDHTARYGGSVTQPQPPAEALYDKTNNGFQMRVGASRSIVGPGLAYITIPKDFDKHDKFTIEFPEFIIRNYSDLRTNDGFIFLGARKLDQTLSQIFKFRFVEGKFAISYQKDQNSPELTVGTVDSLNDLKLLVAKNTQQLVVNGLTLGEPVSTQGSGSDGQVDEVHFGAHGDSLDQPLSVNISKIIISEAGK